MTATGGWTRDELERIAAAEELELAPMRLDGSLRKPVTMWVVRHGRNVYVRSVNGRGSSWFRVAQAKHQARVAAGGVERDVSLIEIEEVNDELDIAYRAKYGHYRGPTARITSAEARAATLLLVPQETTG